MKMKRVDMRVPEVVLKEVEKYKEENGVASRTAAFLELVRKGLEQKKKAGE